MLVSTFHLQAAHKLEDLGRYHTASGEGVLFDAARKGTHALVFFIDLGQAKFEDTFEEPSPPLCRVQ
jgi:hypothetical protein